MLDLADIPFFSELMADALHRVRGVTDTRRFPNGSVICRKGDEGRAFYAVASGGVSVELETGSDPGAGRVFMGPGEVFGEMSILSDLPVSATVVAVQPTDVHVIPRRAFAELLESVPALQLALTRMLVSRVRERTGSARERRPRCALLVLDGGSEGLVRAATAVSEGVKHYASASRFVENAAGDPRHLISSWRVSAVVGSYLVLCVDAGSVTELSQCLERGDVVATVEDPAAGSHSVSVRPSTGLADYQLVTIGTGSAASRPAEGPWGFALPPDEIEAALEGGGWQRDRYPALDWIARWITGREIGFALGAGAARGFAHLGVLEVLENAGVPIDCLVGSSMGGIVALSYALTGSARRAIELVERTIGCNGKIRDVSWLPRSSFFVGDKVRCAAREIGGNLMFSQLLRPAFVVAADLANAERVVLDSGPIEQAFLATSAIPGLFPAQAAGGRFMVDGALVSRIPVDLLDRRRCGVKIAVNVIPSPDRDGGRMRAKQMEQEVGRIFGLRHTIARSWELLGWWHGASDAASADILIEPVTQHAGHDFDRFRELVEAGREAARRKLDRVRGAVESLLEPGTNRRLHQSPRPDDRP